MITEDYVSFEVAKLLKEKGFNNPCLRVYDNKGIICIRYTGFDVPHDYFNRQLYLCPTHQMTMKWLREKHKILITIIPQEVNIGVDRMCYAIYRITEDLYQPLYNGKVGNLVDSYEEAIEAALKYVLENLI